MSRRRINVSADPRSERQLDRRQRMALILARDGGCCVWCRRPLEIGFVLATTDHLVPRIKGGPSWIENEVASCSRCNGERGHRTPGDWFDECLRRGWEPDHQVVVAALRALQEAIAERGGQRRARQYVASQLRRLDRLGIDGRGARSNRTAGTDVDQ